MNRCCRCFGCCTWGEIRNFQFKFDERNVVVVARIDVVALKVVAVVAEVVELQAVVVACQGLALASLLPVN